MRIYVPKENIISTDSTLVISSGVHLGRKVAGIGISQGRPGGSGCLARLALTASATENPPEGARSGSRSTVIEVEVTIRTTRIIRTFHFWHFYPSPSFGDSHGKRKNI